MARVMNNLGIRPLLSHPPSSPQSPPTQYSLTTRQNKPGGKIKPGILSSCTSEEETTSGIERRQQASVLPSRRHRPRPPRRFRRGRRRPARWVSRLTGPWARGKGSPRGSDPGRQRRSTPRSCATSCCSRGSSARWCCRQCADERLVGVGGDAVEVGRAGEKTIDNNRRQRKKY